MPGTNMTAANDVFATFELLEAILLSTPPLDLVLSLAVSRTWHQTVLSSNPLQQRLFFAPAPVDTPWTQNSILTAKFWPIFQDGCRTDDLAEKLRAGCWGPCVYGHTPSIRYLMAGPPCGDPSCWNPRCQSPTKGFTAAGQEAYFRPEASWRRMLAMQPPVNMLRILQYGFSREDPRKEDEKRLGPRKVMQISQRSKSCGAFARVGLESERRAKGVIQWDMWDVVAATDEDEGSQGNESLYVIEGEEGMDRHTLVFVDWWMDRSAQVMNNDGEVESLELRRMAGIEIAPWQ